MWPFFDAVSASLGLAPKEISWEGEAACYLQTAALACHKEKQSEIIERYGHLMPVKIVCLIWAFLVAMGKYKA